MADIPDVVPFQDLLHNCSHSSGSGILRRPSPRVAGPSNSTSDGCFSMKEATREDVVLELIRERLPLVLDFGWPCAGATDPGCSAGNGFSFN